MYNSEINREDSDQENFQIPNWLPKKPTIQSPFGDLFNPPIYGERPLIMSFDKGTPDKNIFKPKDKKNKIKKPCDYRKNICGYITKKIIREYFSPTYRLFVEELCKKYECAYAASKSHFLSKIERITGPSHIPCLFIPANQEEKGIKAAFKEFFTWFVKQRYLRYLLLEGKMEQKEAYIEYKNTVLMSIINKQEGSDVEVSSESFETNREGSSSNILQLSES